MKYVLNKDTRIAYDIKKNKTNPEVTIFLHGLGGNSTAWKRVTILLNNSSVLIDLREHGKSEKTSKKLILNDFVNDISLILKKERIKKAKFVGHCFGALIALEFANQYPDKVSEVILINPLANHMLLKNQFIRDLFAEFVNMIGNNKSFKNYKYYDYSRLYNKNYLHFLRKDIRSMPLTTYMKLHILSSKYNIRRIKKLKLPVKVIIGKKDLIIPINESRKYFEYIKKKNIYKTDIIILNTDHLIPIRMPQKVVEYL